jgi:CBS domain-containing protein
MKVKDAMHKGVDWVSPDTPVTELAKLMCEHDNGSSFSPFHFRSRTTAWRVAASAA